MGIQMRGMRPGMANFGRQTNININRGPNISNTTIINGGSMASVMPQMQAAPMMMQAPVMMQSPMMMQQQMPQQQMPQQQQQDSSMNKLMMGILTKLLDNFGNDNKKECSEKKCSKEKKSNKSKSGGLLTKILDPAGIVTGGSKSGGLLGGLFGGLFG